jgi:hypothetical protein
MKFTSSISIPLFASTSVSTLELIHFQNEFLVIPQDAEEAWSRKVWLVPSLLERLGASILPHRNSAVQENLATEYD